ncbi:MAG: hypothetical protein Fur0020_02000 [Thermodesulfovibrionia bacterium]
MAKADHNRPVELTVYSANIHKENNDLKRLQEDIEDVNPDVVFLMEVTNKQLEALSELIKKYKYHAIDSRITQKNARGIGVVFLSRYDVTVKRLTPLAKSGNALFEGILQTEKGDIIFYGVHFPRHSLSGSFLMRKREFIAFARLLSRNSKPFIVAGDFNSTPYSPVFKEFLKTSNLSISDYVLSWPALFPPLWIPIDHILTSKEIYIDNKTRGSYIGSDHYPVIADLSFAF